MTKREKKEVVYPPREAKRKAKVASVVLASFVGSFLVLFLVAYAIIGSFFFKFALDATFAAVANAPSDMILEMPTPDTKPEWLENIPKTIREIKSDEGYSLKAYEILNNNNSHKWVITIHGYRGKSTEMSNYAYYFYNEGFNVLMPDLQGHGLSEGNYIGMGYRDRLDILKWIDLIIEQDPEAKIVLHGVSMGGATVMMTTGEKLPENVVCAIEDCGYSNVYEQFDYIVRHVLSLPFPKIIMSASDLSVRANLGVSLKDMDSISQLKKSTTPTLFIHGSEDTFVPFYMLDEVYNANPNLERQKLVIEGASHACSATVNPELYFSTVFEFIAKYI